MDYASALMKGTVKDCREAVEGIIEETKGCEALETASIPPVIRVTLIEAARHTAEDMQAFHEVELSDIPAPGVWLGYISHEGSDFRDAIRSLRKICKEQSAGEDALAFGSQEVFLLTEQALHAMREASRYFRVEQETLLRSREDMQKHVATIQHYILSLQELMNVPAASTQTREQISRAQTDSMDCILGFNHIYTSARHPSGKAHPMEMNRLYTTARESLETICKDFEICVLLKEGAMKVQAKDTFAFLAYTAARVARNAKAYMANLEKASRNIYKQGSSIRLVHLTSFFGTSKQKDLVSEFLIRSQRASRYSAQPLSESFVREALSEGLTGRELQTSFHAFLQGVRATLRQTSRK